MPVVVSNASPLIILAKAELLDILRDQFGTILVPQAVIEEILAGPPDDVMAGQLRGQTWAKTVSLDPPLTPLAYWRLGRGEAEVLSTPDCIPALRPCWMIAQPAGQQRRLGFPSTGP